MARKYRTIDDAVAIWQSRFPAPVFPVLYFEIIKAEECRGFLQLEHAVGDIDFVGYPLGDHDIIVDSLGRVFDLKFDEMLYPNSVISTWSVDDIKGNIMPTLKYAGNDQLTNEVLNEKNVAAIVEKMATFFAW